MQSIFHSVRCCLITRHAPMDVLSADNRAGKQMTLLVKRKFKKIKINYSLIVTKCLLAHMVSQFSGCFNIKVYAPTDNKDGMHRPEEK